ncbi:hypothetical protein SAMN05216301_1083 [Morganella morganii]|nr:hypothetical protein SAMN05216301_1083 [Morganella morganii]
MKIKLWFKIMLLFVYLLPPPENGLPGFISNIQGILLSAGILSCRRE